MRRKLRRGPFPQGRCVVDFETDGLQPYDGARPFIVGMEDEQGQVRRYRASDPDFSRVFKGVVEDPSIEKIAHGAKFEVKHSRHLGMTPRGTFHDTMAKAVLVDEYQRHGLGFLSERWLQDSSKGIVEDWLNKNKGRIRREAGREANYADVPAPLLEKYLEGDLDKTLRLDWLWRRVESEFPELYKMETDLAYDIAEMEDFGLRVDLEYIHRMIREFKPRMEELARDMNSIAGVRFNPAAHAQVSRILEDLGLDTGERNEDGSMKTRYELLEAMDPDQHPFLDRLIRWRALQKMTGTYLEPFSQRAWDGVLHGSIWQYGQDEGIKTGRMSSADPNLQNIPGGGRGKKTKLQVEFARTIRRAIIPPPGHSLLFFDYKQIEMVIFTCLAGDEQTLDELRRGVDIYVAHGKKMLGENAFEGLDKELFKLKRFEAKELCLSFIYGMGLKKFARRVKLTPAEAKQRRDAYFAASPRARQFMLHVVRDILQNGLVKDVFGRNYHVPKELAYKGVNAICQGPAATILKKGIIRSRALGALGVKRLMPIHDELMCAVPTDRLLEAAREGKRLLEDRETFPIPIEVDVSYSETNWAEKKELDLRDG